jgi:hypothetical protein
MEKDGAPLASQLRANPKRWYDDPDIRLWSLNMSIPLRQRTLESSMHAPHERPLPAINLAELRYCLAFGSTMEDMADFLHRDVKDVRHAIEARRAASLRSH